jgi:hypothetical protein
LERDKRRRAAAAGTAAEALESVRRQKQKLEGRELWGETEGEDTRRTPLHAAKLIIHWWQRVTPLR